MKSEQPLFGPGVPHFASAKQKRLRMMRWLKWTFAFSCLLLPGSLVLAQTERATEATIEQTADMDIHAPPRDGLTDTGLRADELSHARIMSIAVLIFGTIILSLVVFVTFKSGHSWTPMSFQLVALTIIISAALFLMTAGYNDKQLTPVVGLLGTIAGYILGQASVKKDQTTNDSEQGE